MASRELGNGMADPTADAHTKGQKQNRNIFHIVTVGFLILAVGLQVVLRDAKLQYSTLLEVNPFLRGLHSPAAQATIDEPAVCENQPFPTAAPTSRPLKMPLEAETKRIVDQFEYTDDDVNKGVKEFLRQMEEGLAKDGTSLSQIPTYVAAVPSGKEQGLYLAVDLGGTNFRVCSVHLNGDNTYDLNFNKVAIPKELMVAKTSEELFAFLAKQIEVFLKDHHEDHFESLRRRREATSATNGYREEDVFRLGFTFSFPVDQVGINKGNLIRWTKGFDIDDTVGKDVCALLQAELDKLKLPVKVAALVNDTVGTLMARAYTSPSKKGTILGAIFGTGTNGAYMEKYDNIKKGLKGTDYVDTTGEMIINAEWGSFDNQLNVLPSTPWDNALDRESNNPGVQMFEKRVSGMFLGEILRQAIVDAVKNDKVQLFKQVELNSSSSPLFTSYGVDSAIMSDAAEDNTPELATLRKKLSSEIGLADVSVEDAQAFKAISAAVGRRAARLSAVAVAAVVLKTGKLTHPDWEGEQIDIGVDGSLFQFYPQFPDMIYEALRAIDGIGEKGAEQITIGLTQDGSGVGAALIALIAAEMEKSASGSK
ncbi:hypothetical protein PspLS_08174 [Pyricularia sp. CBS 133598]|nr:hypothetical protein PspLS_08174 [Pyricularia sp. CBS 133598]